MRGVDGDVMADERQAAIRFLYFLDGGLVAVDHHDGDVAAVHVFPRLRVRTFPIHATPCCQAVRRAGQPDFFMLEIFHEISFLVYLFFVYNNLLCLGSTTYCL